MAHSRSPSRTCRREGCDEKHVYKKGLRGEKIYSPYCEQHTCGWRPVTEPFTHFCPHWRSVGYTYCSHHRRCGVTGCPNSGEFRAPGSNLPWFCDAHRCIMNGCFHPRPHNAQICQHHLMCRYPQCLMSLVPGQARQFCPHHTCRIRDCCNYVFAQNRCIRHMSCRVQGCDRFQVVAPDGQRTTGFCDRHVPCRAERCNNFASEGSEFCNRHTCEIRGCANPRRNDPNYCDVHKCRVQDCHEAVSDPRNFHSCFCHYHTCKAAECFHQAKVRGGFCDEHGCNKHRCPEERGHHEPYCREHRCHIPRCPYEAKVPYGHCLAHACEVVDCGQVRLGVGRFGDLCALHYQVRAEEQMDSTLRGREEELAADFERLRVEQELERERERERERLREAELERIRERERERDRERRRRERSRHFDHESDYGSDWRPRDPPRDWHGDNRRRGTWTRL